MMFSLSPAILSFDITMSFPEGHFPTNVDAAVTNLLSFHRKSVRLLFLSVTTSEAPLSSLSISFIGHKGAFSTRLILTVPVVAMPLAFRMRSRFGLVKKLSIMMW